MPDDYYVSQYSGEEIDALLGSAGAGTVRYDAASDEYIVVVLYG